MLAITCVMPAPGTLVTNVRRTTGRARSKGPGRIGTFVSVDPGDRGQSKDFSRCSRDIQGLWENSHPG